MCVCACVCVGMCAFVRAWVCICVSMGARRHIFSFAPSVLKYQSLKFEPVHIYSINYCAV